MLREVERVLFLKSCPRCQGDMHANRDFYGSYKECLQCGYMQDADRPNGELSKLIAREKKVA